MEPLNIEIFPKGCQMAYEEDGRLKGRLKRRAKRYLYVINSSLNKGKGAEHPCYGCNMDCNTRQVEYQDPLKRYIVEPTRT